MSKVASRFSLAQARDWAWEAMGIVSHNSPRVQIAGSIRRERADVGDVDLVVFDISEENPWVRHSISRELMEIGYAQTKDGDRIASFTREGKAPLDLYFATAETWGITLLIRTGSAAHNIRLVQHGKRLAPARRLSVAQGVLDTADKVIASRTEEEIFGALHLRWIDPVDREAPDLEHLVGAES